MFSVEEGMVVARSICAVASDLPAVVDPEAIALSPAEYAKIVDRRRGGRRRKRHCYGARGKECHKEATIDFSH